MPVITVLEHDDYGNPLKISDEEGRVTRYRYGVLNRVLEIIEDDPFVAATRRNL